MRGIPAAFKEVSPGWYAIFTAAKTTRSFNDHFTDENGKDRFLGKGWACVVGEANDFMEEYWAHDDNPNGCSECSHYSNLFWDIIQGVYDETGSRKKQILKNIKGFTAHWKEKHNPLLGQVPTIEKQTLTPKVK